MKTRWRQDGDEIEMKCRRDGDDCYINDKFEDGQGNRVELTWDMKKAYRSHKFFSVFLAVFFAICKKYR